MTLLLQHDGQDTSRSRTAAAPSHHKAPGSIAPLLGTRHRHQGHRHDGSGILTLAGWSLLPALCLVASVRAHSPANPMIQDDAVVLGLLCLVLKLIFSLAGSEQPLIKRVMRVLPTLCLAYFIPGTLASAGVVSAKHSRLPDVATTYLLPACVVLLTIGSDLPLIKTLGGRCLGAFFAATMSIMIGGPIAMLLIGTWDRQLVSGEAWQGLMTVPGSWIGGAANQLALKEIFKVSDEAFAKVIVVDVVITNVWMSVLLSLTGRTLDIDEFFRADSRSIHALSAKLEAFNADAARVTSFDDIVTLGSVSFGAAGAATWLGSIVANWVQLNVPVLHKLALSSPYFWMVNLVTTAGLLMSLTRLRGLEGAGASKLGSYAVFLLVSIIGMRLDLSALGSVNGLLAVAVVWILIHGSALFWFGFATHTPFFFLAVGSQANIGGTASAPIVAAAFNQALAPVGVLLAILGSSIGTVCGYVTGIGIRAVARYLGVDETVVDVLQPRD